MGKQDWYEMGAQIGDLVQSAIDSNNYKQLNQSITDTINATVDMMQKSVQNAMNQSKAYEEKQANGKRSGSFGSEDGRTAFEKAMAKSARAGENAYNRSMKAVKAPSVKTAGNWKGILLMSLGYSMAFVFGILMIVFTSLKAVTGVFGIPSLFMMIFFVVTMLMGIQGTRLHHKSSRQKLYLQIMGERDTCTIKELAAGCGKSEKFVRKDLKEMIQSGMFPQGAYMDAGETCLMTSSRAYQQYQSAEEQYQKRKAEMEGKQAEQAKKDQARAALSEEVQNILKEGQDFISHIHQCNDAIADEEMTQKLSRLENIVAKIFYQVEKNPESASDLHKMMSYYLPITRKLVDAYKDMDSQAMSGQNIDKTKKEINASLDTINTAFENLFDSFFQDTAWDISSDITVLKTMMAQDGLMKKDFASGEQIKKTAGDLQQGV